VRLIVAGCLLQMGSLAATPNEAASAPFKARHVMNRRITVATPRAIGRDLALQLLSGTYSSLPVVDGTGKVIGVVTEFDLLRAVRAVSSNLLYGFEQFMALAHF
jgi:CBS domain-containing protein